MHVAVYTFRLSNLYIIDAQPCYGTTTATSSSYLSSVQISHLNPAQPLQYLGVREKLNVLSFRCETIACTA